MKFLLFGLLLLSVYLTVDAQEDCPQQDGSLRLSQQDQQAMQLGYQVIALRDAIQNPASPDAMADILELGLDSRYYLMVRGWLQVQLQGDMSIAASKDNTPAKIVNRIELLQKALRAIDLE